MDSNYYAATFENYGLDEKTLLINFLNFVQDSLIVAHNALFDMNFLNKEIAFRGLKTIEINRFRCTMEIFKKRFTHRNSYSTLSKCAEYFKILLNENLLHSAIYDALVCTKIFIQIIQELAPEKAILNHINNHSNTRSRLKQSVPDPDAEKKTKPHKEKDTVKDKISNHASNIFSIHTHELERLLSLKSKNNSVLDIPSNEINMLLNESTNGIGGFLSPDLNRIHFENETQTDTVNLHQIDFT
jgi:DNA polymerase III epsilon subunit-like protein